MTEKIDLTTPIVTLLLALERHGAPVYGTRSNAGRVQTIHGRYVELNRPGWPDITACVKGRFVGIETKSAKGYQQESQKEAEKGILAAGGVYLIVRTLRDIREWLGEEGLL